MTLEFKESLKLRTEVRSVLDDIEAESDSDCCYHRDAEIELSGLDRAAEEIIELFKKFLESKPSK